MSFNLERAAKRAFLVASIANDQICKNGVADEEDMKALSATVKQLGLCVWLISRKLPDVEMNIKGINEVLTADSALSVAYRDAVAAEMDLPDEPSTP